MENAGRSRRDMMRATALAAGAMIIGAGGRVLAADEPAPTGSDPWKGLKIGVASYSLRKLPLDACIRGIQRVGLHYVSIKDFHLKMTSTPEERKTVAKKFTDAGITPLSAGVISLAKDEVKSRAAFEYCKDIAVPTMVCTFPNDALPVVDKLVKEYGIKLAIHNHGPGDRWPTPYDVLKTIEGSDPRIGLCIDVGHTLRAGVKPEEAVIKCKDRLYDMHLKDVDKAEAKGQEIECGRGVMNIPAILKALLEVKFAGHVGFEHEKDANDPVPGLAESVGYVKGVLVEMKG
jgi:inosose dehydratase